MRETRFPENLLRLFFYLIFFFTMRAGIMGPPVAQDCEDLQEALSATRGISHSPESVQKCRDDFAL